MNLVKCAVLTLSMVGTVVAGEAPMSLEQTQQPTEWVVNYKQQKLMVYSYAPQKCKPYVKELYTLKGENILRDSPFDHLHHHALMYAIKVNGVNFWEEVSGCGMERAIETSKPVFGTDSRGLPQATLTQQILWLAPTEALMADTAKAAQAALLLETRTVTVTVNEAQQEVALHWKGEFTVGTKTNEVSLTGAFYHGLGMRFLKELDPIATRQLSTKKAEELADKQDISPAKWGSVSFDRPGQPASIALFGHPSNARGDSVFFSMKKPFAYLSATQGLDKAPLVYKAGDKFELNYLVVLYPELKTTEALQARSQEWEKSKN